MSLYSDVGASFSWGETVLLVDALREDPSTYLGAAAAGWYRPASMTDLATITLTRAVLGALTSKDSKPPSLEFLFPWVKPPRDEPVDRATVDDAVARLNRFSAFRS